MANVQEMQMMELMKELDVLNAQLAESREANAKLRRRVEDLKSRNAQLER